MTRPLLTMISSAELASTARRYTGIFSPSATSWRDNSPIRGTDAIRVCPDATYVVFLYRSVGGVS